MIQALILVAVLCAVLTIPVGIFNTKVFQAVNGTKCTGMNRVKAYIPIYNILYARKYTYGNATVYIILLCVSMILLLLRLISILLLSVADFLVIFTAFGSVISILIFYGVYMFNAVDFARMFNCGFITILCCVLVTPVGYYMLSLNVLPYYHSVEDEVSERFG